MRKRDWLVQISIWLLGLLAIVYWLVLVTIVPDKASNPQLRFRTTLFYAALAMGICVYAIQIIFVDTFYPYVVLATLYIAAGAIFLTYIDPDGPTRRS